MALRLKRGTNAERAAYTLELGELVYVTDYNTQGVSALWVGDGTTLGGNPVDNNTVTDTLSDLADVDTTGVQVGEVLKWNGAAFVPSPEGAVTPGATYSINIDGDLSGSVFSDDSSVIIDGLTGTVLGDVRNNLVRTNSLIASQGNILTDVAGGDTFTITSLTLGGNGPNFNFRASNGTIDSPTALTAGDAVVDIAANGHDGTSYVPSAVIKMGPDKYTTSIGTGVMPGRIVFLTFDETGATGASNSLVFNRFGRLGINTDNPSEKLDVVGNIKASGSIQPGVYADATARDTAITSPVEGMMVFLQDIQKFTGYVSDTGLAGGGASNSTPGWININ